MVWGNRGNDQIWTGDGADTIWADKDSVSSIAVAVAVMISSLEKVAMTYLYLALMAAKIPLYTRLQNVKDC